MNICCLNVSEICWPLALYAQGATASVEPYPRMHRLGSSLSPRIVDLLTDRRGSSRIAAERKNHLTLARTCNEANTVGIDESETYKNGAVIKKLRRSAGRAAKIFIK